MASEPSIFYVNRDNYLASLDASRRAADHTGAVTGALDKYAEANLAGQALMTREITASLSSGFSGMHNTMQKGFNGMGNAMERGFSGVERSIGEMGCTMHDGFARLNDAVVRSALNVCDELYKINKTLNRWAALRRLSREGGTRKAYVRGVTARGMNS